MNETNYIPERRPIASRTHPFSIRIADRLARQGASPNAISIFGMIAGAAAGAAFPFTRLEDWGWLFFFLAALLMLVRLLANMFDGMVAVQTGKASPVGELYNEVPDRVSDTAIFIGAGYAAGAGPEFGYLAAIGALFTAYIRAEGKVAGAHQEFCGPLAKPQRMAILGATAVICAFLPASWHEAVVSRLGYGVMAIALLIIAVGSFFTALRRLARVARTLRRGAHE